jgi:hypothetical protein
MLIDCETETSNSTPYDQLCLQEFIEGLMIAGSVISILENKKLTPVNFFLCLLESKQYQQIFTEITCSDTFRQALTSLFFVYPNLAKSRITKTALRKNKIINQC